MDPFNSFIQFLVLVVACVISFAILHAVIRSAVSQAMQRHTLWFEGRAAQPVAAGSIDANTETNTASDWTLDIRGTSYTVRQQNSDLWSIILGEKPVQTVRRDARGFYADGSSGRFGTLEEVVRDAPRV